MATFRFDLVSPEKMAFSGDVDQVDVPGADGDFGVLAGHALLVTTQRPGILTIYTGGKQTRLVVLGGTAEISPKGLTVLADTATSVEDLDRALFAKRIADMEAAVAKGGVGEALDREIARLDHFRTIKLQLEGTALH